MRYNAVKFTKNVGISIGEEMGKRSMGVTTTIEADGRVKATVKASMPNPGCELKIDDVKYEDGKAIIHYRISPPQPGMMVAQVITDAEASIYLTGEYTEVTAEQVGRAKKRTDAKLLE